MVKAALNRQSGPDLIWSFVLTTGEGDISRGVEESGNNEIDAAGFWFFVGGHPAIGRAGQ